MSGTRWHCTVDQALDPLEAFRQARATVFASGSYVGPGGTTSDGQPDPRPRPDAIEEVLEAQHIDDTCGTSSILDIAHFEIEGGPPRPRWKHVNPFTRSNEMGGTCRLATSAELVAAFGTERPSRDTFIAALNRLDPRPDEALCVLLWHDDRRTGVGFCGKSRS